MAVSVAEINLDDFKGLSRKAIGRRLKNMTEDEQLAVVDAVIDRDAQVWKDYVRNHPYDRSYYFDHILTGLALTERQR